MKIIKTLIIIPAYNEEIKIAYVIRGITERYSNIEILVVDDGSNDQTRIEATEAGAKVISHPFNLGYGVALQTGYKYALTKGYEAVVQIDGDGQHDPSFIQDLLDVIQEERADIAIGSRFLEVKDFPSKGERYQTPFVRRLGMKFFGMVASLMIGQKITDPTSGYQAMNRKVLEWVSSDRFPYDYPDADVIIMLHRSGFRIQEVPVRMFPNQSRKSMHSGWKPIYYIFKMFLSILVTMMRK